MMHLQLITLSGVQLDREIYELIAPTPDGEIAIFPSHEPLVTLVKDGALAVRYNKEDSDDKLDYYAVTGGVLDVDYTSVRVLVDEADFGEDIAEEEAKEALERAKKLRDEATDQVELEKAHQLLDRQAVRLKVAELQRRRRR